MKSFALIFASVILSIGIIHFFGVASPSQTSGNDSSKMKESVYERVLRTKTLRCGYFVEPPITMRDENKDTFSGIAPDLVRIIAKELDIQIEWAEQLNFATFQQDLNNNRYDMVCGGIFILPRAGLTDYSNPYLFVSANGYVKKGNNRFQGKAIDDLNTPEITISGLDGEGATYSASKRLPDANMVVLPQLSNISDMLLEVSTGKTDIAFVLPSVFADFNKNNPDKLQRAGLKEPIDTYAVSFAVPRNEYAFKSLINNMLTQLQTSGELERVVRKHDQKGHFTVPFHSKK